VSGIGGRTCAPRAIAWLCALTASIAPHASWGGGDDARAARIFDALQVEAQLAEISRAATASIDASARGLPPGDRLLLRAAVSAGFDPHSVRQFALDRFSARLDRAHAEAALAWLSRAETQALLGRATSTPPPARRDPGAEPAAEERLRRDALLEHFDRHSGRAARAEKDAVLVLAAMLRVANPLLPLPQRYTPDEIERLLAAQRARVASPSPGAAALRERYRGIATAEIEAALTFLESPAGAWLEREVDRALERALVTAAEATVAHLVDSFGAGGAPIPLRMASARRP